MNRALRVATVLSVAASSLVAQQFGDSDRDYLVNFNGSFSPSFVQSSICAGQEAMSNNYFTSASSMPFIWAMASAGTIGWFTNTGNSVDIGPAGLTFLLNGTDPSNPVNLFAYLDNFGAASLNVGSPANLAGALLYFCMAHIDPMAPSGFYVSQTHEVTFTSPTGSMTPTVGPNPGTTPDPMATALTLSDDSFAVLNLAGAGFPYYGTTYTICYVGSNGYVTFVNGDTTFFSDPFGLSFGDPRIAIQWQDLNPGQGGTVSAYADPTGGFEVTYTGVPEFFNTGSNTMQLRAVPGTSISMNYDVAMTLTDGLVGLSPGNGGIVTSTDLSNPVGGSTLINLGEGLYEEFGVTACGSTFDLNGYQLIWLLDVMGNPFAQN
jgi:hypothetical protein